MKRRIKHWSIALTCLALSCCAHAGSTTEAQLHGALDVLADVIAPSSRISAEACTAREEAEVAQAEAGKQTAAQARADLAVIRRRCDGVRETFERMADAHAQARSLLEQGAVERARAQLEQVRGLWRELATKEATP